mgnify:CR=1 FL=1|jgi:hypothetical protein
MKTFKTLLAASALIALSATAAFAGGAGSDQYGTWNDSSSQGSGSQILNNQINLQNNWSNLTGVVDTVGGDVVAQGSAAGNMIDVTTMNNTRVQNNQIVGAGATIGSNVTLDANNVWGSVGVQNQVLCNGASVSTDPVLTAVHSNQECHASDPYSGVSAYVTNVAGNAVFQGSAISNSFEADSNAPNMPISSRQLNNSASVSNMNVAAGNVGGTVAMSSSAIGNTSQIIHYNTN